MAAGISVTLGNPGTLDPRFSGDGKVTTAIGAGDDRSLFSVLIQPDGKIVLAGAADNASNQDFALLRYKANGSLDTSFDHDGKVTTAIGTGDDGIASIALQADGSIVAAGFADNGTDHDMAFARYTATGALDASFNGGKFALPFGAGDDIAFGIALQADGKVVVAGGSGAPSDFALMRLTDTGALDGSFGDDGKVLTPIVAGNDSATQVLIQPDGRILAGGVATVGSDYQFALARYNSDGTLDTAFDGDGMVLTPVGSGFAFLYDIALQADGKILAAGYSLDGVSGNYAYTLLRYNADGSLDTSFDGDGMLKTAIGAGDATGIAMQPLADGRILLAGAVYPGDYATSDGDFAVACYQSNGALDASFGTGGIAVYSIGGDDLVSGLAVQPDGGIVIGGSSDNGSNFDFAAMRLYGAANTLSGTARNDTLSGAAGADTLIGLAGADQLKGQAGNDALSGGAGNDKLTGGTGADNFVFDAALTGNLDTILDFKHAQRDHIQLDNDVFKRLGTADGTVKLAAARFLVIGAHAQDSNDYILYDQASGALYYDKDASGAGAAVQFATLSTHPVLAVGDFQVIA